MLSETEDAQAIALPGFCRLDLFCIIALLIVWLAVSLPRLHGPIDLRWDASTYFVLGTSLAQGKGYRLLNEPGEIEAVQYPPLLPLIVAAFERAMRTNNYIKVGSALRLFYFVISGFYLLSIYALARRLLAPFLALFVSVTTALAFYSFLHPSDTLYAEMPFAFLSILFLLTQQHSHRTGYRVLTPIFAIAAYMLRTAGLALLASWVAQSLLQRRFREAAVRAAVAVIPVVLWQAYIWRVTSSEQYLHPVYSYQRAPYYYSNVTYGANSRFKNPFRPDWGRTGLSSLPARVIRNLAAAPISLGESALVDRAFSIPGHKQKTERLLHFLLAGVGICALAGAVLVARGKHWFLSLYFAVMTGLVVITPWPDQFWRYFAPLTPLTLIFFTVTILTLRRWLVLRNVNWSGVATLLVVVLPIAGILSIQVAVAVFFLRNMLPVSYYDSAGREQALHLLTYDRHWHSLDYAFEWIRRNAKADTIFATAVPHMAYLRSGHKAVLPPFVRNRARAGAQLDEVPVDYFVIDQLGRPFITENYAAPIIKDQPGNWRLVYTAPDQGADVYARVR